MSAYELRKKYGRKLLGLSKYSRLAAWAVVGAYIFQISIGIFVGNHIIGGDLDLSTALVLVAILVFLGTRLRGLNNIVHECTHATFSTHRRDNERIGKFCASLILGSFTDYRDEHLTHHMHLGDYEMDRDFQGIRALRLEEPLTRSVVFRHLVTPFTGRHLPYYVRINLSDRDGKIWQILKASILFCTIAYSAASPLSGVVILIIPFLFVFTSLNYWADCLDHAGLFNSKDDFETSRNVAVPALFRLMFFPRNDSFHLVHHLFPQVPARHLPTVHEYLKQDHGYAERPNAVSSWGSIGRMAWLKGALAQE